MTGIPVPTHPLLPRDADPQALRTVQSVSKLAAMLPVEQAAPDGLQGLNGQSVHQRQVGSLPGLPTLPGQPAPASSTRETLSLAARTILDLLERIDMQPARGASALVPVPPSSADGASLRTLLAQLVGHSGMFYESHLADWVRGGRSLADLMSEPQAILGMRGSSAALMAAFAPRGGSAQAPAPMLLLPVPAHPAGPTGTAPSHDMPASGPLSSHTSAPTQSPDAAARQTPGELALVVAAASTQDDPASAVNPASPKPNAGNAVDADTGKLADSSHADTATTGRAQQGGEAPAAAPRKAPLGQQATQAYESVARDAGLVAPWTAHAASHPGASDQAANSASALRSADSVPVHSASEGLVRGQLELLATQQFRWVGEAWPGTPMDWAIGREPRGEHGVAADQPEGAWSTRLRLTLPQLGVIDARLTLNGTGLEAHIVAADPAVITQMNAARSALSGNLSANGLVLMRLAIESGQPAPPGAPA